MASVNYTNIINTVVAIGILITTILAYKANSRSKANTSKLDEVHTMVNSQLTDATDRRDASEKRLIKAETRTDDAEKRRDAAEQKLEDS